jgi:hypothetical protein
MGRIIATIHCPAKGAGAGHHIPSQSAYSQIYQKTMLGYKILDIRPGMFYNTSRTFVLSLGIWREKPPRMVYDK